MKKTSRTKPSYTVQTKTNTASKNRGEVRIIAGIWRGRKLPVLDSQGLRPTTDRIKETLFNWLMPYIVGARCLDCFAGSGSLGFEALSRQASAVQFFELDKAAAKQLQKNLQRLDCSNGTIQQGDSLQLLAYSNPLGNPHVPFDIVFIDPPFQQNLIAPTLDLLTQHHWLSDDALIYIESEKQLGEINTPPNWQLLKEKIGGEVCFRLYQNNVRSED